MSANFPRIIFERFIEFSGRLSKQLALATEDDIETSLHGIVDLIALLPESKGIQADLRTYLTTLSDIDELDPDELELISRSTKIMGALASDMAEARVALRKRGVLPPEGENEQI